jgi:hypothetical protein
MAGGARSGGSDDTWTTEMVPDADKGGTWMTKGDDDGQDRETMVAMVKVAVFERVGSLALCVGVCVSQRNESVGGSGARSLARVMLGIRLTYDGPNPVVVV